MGVYFRTGESSAAGVSWPIYLFFVLPIQMLWLFARAFLYLLVLLATGVVWVSRFARDRWNERKPPHPEG